jgi:hypothetical protein
VTTIPTTDAAATSDSTAPADTTAPPPGSCPTSAPIASGATEIASISGDIDGDTLPDAVTSYSLDGVPHVHATLATGSDSDTEVLIGNADTVTIQFLDFDRALGAEVPPPLAVLAIGATKAGTAVGTFLTLTPQYCIRVWHTNTSDDTLFSFRISAEPIYQGLQCDGAAGSINHSLTSAEQNGAGEMHDVETFTVPDDPDIQHQYGDLTTCGITLFP